MKNIFTRTIITDSAFRQQKIAREAINIMLAVTLLGLGIAGFLAIFHQIMENKSEEVTAPLDGRSPNRSLLTYAFPSLQLSCSPLLEQSTVKNSPVLWNGICRPISLNNQRSFRLTLTANTHSKKFHGFKLAKEVLYVFNQKDFSTLETAVFTASGISAYAIGGATYLKAKSTKKNIELKIFGIGLGFGILVDKTMRLDLTEIQAEYAAKI